ncbi:MAG: hypothetical protein R3B09_21885 [Nannocystaceae bacterium]
MTGIHRSILRSALTWLAPVAASTTLLLGCSDGGKETDTDTDDSATSTSTGTTTTAETTSTTTGTESDSDSTSTTTSTTDTTTTTTTTTTGTESDTDETTTGGPIDCDPQDINSCPEGQKCTSYGVMPGDYWNGNKCVPVMGDDLPGEACMILTPGDVPSGVDTCAPGSICLFAEAGVCYEFCDLSDKCNSLPGICVQANDGALPICLLTCDPLLQDCPGDQGCYRDVDNNGYICADADTGMSNGMDNDICEYDNQCLKGLNCLPAEMVANCDQMSMGCCAPYCDTTMGADQCDKGEECIAALVDPPPEYMDVGLCAIPP